MRKIEIAKAVDKTRGQALKTYGSRNSRKIAEESLTFCEEWAIINCDDLDQMDRKSAKRSCKEFVKKKIEEEKVGSIFLSILISIVVKLIVEWIINRFIYNLNLK